MMPHIDLSEVAHVNPDGTQLEWLPVGDLRQDDTLAGAVDTHPGYLGVVKAVYINPSKPDKVTVVQERPLPTLRFRKDLVVAVVRPVGRRGA